MYLPFGIFFAFYHDLRNSRKICNQNVCLKYETTYETP